MDNRTLCHPGEPVDGARLYVDERGFECESGETIRPLRLAYETWGELNDEKDNAVLIHHALSVGSHIASTPHNPEPGWWQDMVGPGKQIDTNRYFVICINNLGSCFGSSGPLSVDPATRRPYANRFPAVSIVDMVRSQKILIDAMGIVRLHAVIGSSMGGMLSLTWAALYPERARNLVSISSCAKVYPSNIANRMLQRDIITMDPAWNEGCYTADSELTGFGIARQVGLLTYRHWSELNDRFAGRQGTSSIGNYLRYNADKFIRRFDCNSYLRLLHAMDTFNVDFNGTGLVSVFKRIKARVLVVSVDSDVLFPPVQQRDLYDAMIQANIDATYIEHPSNYGHDAFLVEIDAFGRHLDRFLRGYPVDSTAEVA